MFSSMLEMMGNYEDRKVANTIVGKATIDTAAVTDSSEPFETAVRHPNYNNGNWIIVEMYPNKEEAEKGHERWVKFMENPPKSIKDVSTSEIADFLDAFGDDWRDFNEAAQTEGQEAAQKPPESQ